MAYIPKKGQVVLITLLVLTIATTIALSLISRTTTDTRITNQIGESSVAFHAAEAGIEESLKSGVGTSGPTGIVGAAGVTYKVNVASIGGATGLYTFPKKTLDGVTETLWLAPHVNGVLDESQPSYPSNFDVCWSDESPTKAALAITVFGKVGALYETVKYAYDSDATRALTNNFTSVGSGLGCGAGTGTRYRVTIPVAALVASGIKPLMTRIRPVYSDAMIVINALGAALPQQGNRIESTGSTGDTNRKIVVYQQYRSAASVFDSAIYSDNTFSQ